MIPLDKIQAIVDKHDDLEKKLSAGNVDPKNFAKLSKEYSELKQYCRYCSKLLKI